MVMPITLDCVLLKRRERREKGGGGDDGQLGIDYHYTGGLLLAHKELAYEPSVGPRLPVMLPRNLNKKS